MILAWTSHLSDKEDIAKFQQAVTNSVVLDRLNEILEEMKTEQERREMSEESYDNPNWQYRQADRNGYMRCLSSILKLTNKEGRSSKLLLK